MDGEDQNTPVVQTPTGTTPAGSGNYYKPVGEEADSTAMPAPAQPTTVKPPVPETFPPAVAPSAPVTPTVSAPASLPSVPTMGKPAMPPVAPVASSATVPPTPPTPPQPPREMMQEDSPQEVVSQLQQANAGRGSGWKKVIVGLVIAVVLVGLAVAGWMYWSSQSTTSTLPVQPTPQMQADTSMAMPEDEIDVEIPQDATAAADLPLTSYVQVNQNTAGTGEVSGNICPFGQDYKSGNVIFYEVNTKKIMRTLQPSDTNVFTVSLPAGRYIALFEPDEEGLPKFGFTEYVRCGLKPDTCTDHSLLVLTVEAGQEYGQTQICDPQYKQDGLPTPLKFDYDAL